MHKPQIVFSYHDRFYSTNKGNNKNLLPHSIPPIITMTDFYKKEKKYLQSQIKSCYIKTNWRNQGKEEQNNIMNLSSFNSFGFQIMITHSTKSNINFQIVPIWVYCSNICQAIKSSLRSLILIFPSLPQPPNGGLVKIDIPQLERITNINQKQFTAICIYKHTHTQDLTFSSTAPKPAV